LVALKTFRCRRLDLMHWRRERRTEYLILDRLSWLWFLGFDLGASAPDTNPIRLFREKLTQAGALEALFFAFDRALEQHGHMAMG
jgi:IS5 family transposase